MSETGFNEEKPRYAHIDESSKSFERVKSLYRQSRLYQMSFRKKPTAQEVNMAK